MAIDKSFKAYKKIYMKLIYNLKLENEKSSFQKSVIAKILKLDENNQYDDVMIKPIPDGHFRGEPEVLHLKQFNILIENVSLEDKRGHFFVVDINFDQKNGK